MPKSILFITETIPFPPRNGRELPTAEIISNLPEDKEVSLLIISNNIDDFEKRKDNLASNVKEVARIGYTTISAATRMKREVLQAMPSYFSKTYNYNEVVAYSHKKKYDWVWVSPAGLYSFVLFCREHKILFFDRCAIGMNDIKYGMYYDSLYEMIGYGNYNSHYISRYLRSYLLKRAERKYLKEVNLVHVQTPNEERKTLNILPENKSAVVIAAPNGIKDELLKCEYKGIDSGKVLYMTQLNEQRKTESRWFIKNIWSKILVANPSAELLILGKVEDINHPSLSYVREAKNVKVLGFVDDLVEVYESVEVAVVPIFHGTGLINRILDALTAGIPVVSTTNAINTFGDLQIGKQIIVANKDTEFAKSVVDLMNNSKLKSDLSIAGRKYALSHPSWLETALKINEQLG